MTKADPTTETTFFNSLTNFLGGGLFNVFSSKSGESREGLEKKYKSMIREVETMRAKLSKVSRFVKIIS